MAAEPLDLLVLGSGVAGLSAAVRAAGLGMRVGVLTKAGLDMATTRWAQGGVAAVLGGADPDSTDLHLSDTLVAGDGLCDVDAVRVLVDEGPDRVTELIALGAVFDVDAHGELARAREGGHSVARIVHAGGAATGMEIERALVAAVRETAASVLERTFAVDLLVERGRCSGVVAVPDEGGETFEVRSRHVLLATGGAGQLYAVTTNPMEATGDGTAMALRAGVACADLEFVQFHPTALHHPAMPRPLLSEALRGHGAVLRDVNGERFVDELLPRDKVSRAIHQRLLELGGEHVWLDATALEGFAVRFPTIAATLDSVGLDPARDWLPVAPAAHYCCGGVVADLDGATSLPGLWAAGEVACNGVMGANRLASNSLLDGMVFAPRAVEAIDRGVDGPSPSGAMRAVLGGDDVAAGVIGGRRIPVSLGVDADEPPIDRDQLQTGMSADAGVLRTGESLARAATLLRRPAAGEGIESREVANLTTVAQALVAAALAREETRGAHARAEHPGVDPELAVRFVVGGGSEPADRDVALARDADHLAALVDGRGRGGRVARIGLELLHRAARGVPARRAELQHLRRVAGRIVHRGLGPADDLPPTVDAGGEPMGAAERRERGHHAVPPDEAAADEAGRQAPGPERGAAPVLVERIALGGLGDADDRALGVDAGPLGIAVGPPERTERGELAVAPERGLAGGVAGIVGEAGDPPGIADPVADAGGTAQRRGDRDDPVFRLGPGEGRVVGGLGDRRFVAAADRGGEKHRAG
jgi:L-aspartate oxidase